MATIEERVRELEAWKAEITTKMVSLRAFAIEHRKLYDEFRQDIIARREARGKQEAIEAQKAEDSKQKEKRRNAQT